MRAVYRSQLARLNARGEQDAEHDEQAEDRLRLALLADERAAVVRLRDSARIDDTVLRRAQARLDAEEVGLSAPQPNE